MAMNLLRQQPRTLSEYCSMRPAVRLRPVPREAAEIDRHVYRSDLVVIGAYRCAPDHPWFGEPGPILNHCIVFPRTPSVIEPDGHPPFVGDENTIPIYNAGQRYRRRRVSDTGDTCDYFAVAEPVLREVMRTHDPAAADRARLFTVTHAPGHPSLYLRQRRLFRLAATGVPADRLGMDERVLWLLDAVAGAAGRHPDGAPLRAAPVARRHSALAEAAKLVLAQRLDEPLRLGDLAREVGSSPYHLCRVFRSVTGTTIHEYRQRLRLAAGLTRLEGSDGLTTIALELGYSSHSHFTAAFRGAFGVPPARARGWLRTIRTRRPARARRADA